MTHCRMMDYTSMHVFATRKGGNFVHLLFPVAGHEKWCVEELIPCIRDSWKTPVATVFHSQVCCTRVPEYGWVTIFTVVCHLCDVEVGNRCHHFGEDGFQSAHQWRISFQVPIFGYRPRLTAAGPSRVPMSFSVPSKQLTWVPFSIYLNLNSSNSSSNSSNISSR